VTLSIETLDDRVLPSPMVHGLGRHARHRVRHHHVQPVTPNTNNLTMQLRGAFRTASTSSAATPQITVFSGTATNTGGTSTVIQNPITPTTNTGEPTATTVSVSPTGGTTDTATGAPGSMFFYGTTTTADGSPVIAR